MMKTSDKPTQILNVTSTISQLERHQLRRPIYQVRQTKSMYAKKHQARQPKHQIHQTKNQIRQTKDQARQNTPSMPNTPNQTLSTPNKRPSIYAKQKACTQSKTPNMPKNTKYAKQNAKYAKKHQIRQKTPTTPKFSFMLICCEKNQICQKKHQVHQAKRRVRQKTPNTSKNSNCAKIFIYADLSRNFFLPILRDFWCTFYRPKNYGGVPKKTNMRYV